MASSSRTSPLELRPISIEYGLLPHQDGSATFSFGSLQALASINGPSEVRIRDEFTDRATIEVLVTPLQSPVGLPCTSLATSARSLLGHIVRVRAHPRTLIQISLQTCSVPEATLWSASSAALAAGAEEEEEEAPRPPRAVAPHADAPIPAPEKAALLNAAMAALLHAGTECEATIAAVSAAVLPRAKAGVLRGRRKAWRAGEAEEGGDEMDTDESNASATVTVLDPSPEELRWALSTHVFAFAFSGSVIDPAQNDVTSEGKSKLVFAESAGQPTEFDEYRQTISLCRSAASTILDRMRTSTSTRLAR